MTKPELTDEAIAGGWDEESLAEYVADRERAQAGKILFHPEFRQAPRPRWANNKYRPLRFGR